MNRKRKLSIIFIKAGLVIILSHLISGCSIFDTEDKSPTGPGKLHLSTLMATADTVIIDSTALILKTIMWRDFMPISPEDGKPLIALFWIITLDSTDLPTGLQSDAAWVVHNSTIWDTYFTGEDIPPSEKEPYQLYRVARNGPKFGPKVYVSAVVRLIDSSGKNYFLKAGNQYIGRTD